MCAPYWGGYSPYTFLWNPTIYLSDSSVECPLVVPSSSINYHVVITDIAGCVGNYYTHLSYGGTGVLEIKEDRFLMKVVDVLGSESKPTPNVPLFYRYDDGTVEKRIVVE